MSNVFTDLSASNLRDSSLAKDSSAKAIAAITIESNDIAAPAISSSALGNVASDINVGHRRDSSLAKDSSAKTIATVTIGSNDI
ncbi:MAG TPA: hypothetical protein PLG39_04595, partial [Methanotrichaceae archaeon]|nr:hypothetical protein [Methanotrichaceae archaeon]